MDFSALQLQLYDLEKAYREKEIQIVAVQAKIKELKDRGTKMEDDGRTKKEQLGILQVKIKNLIESVQREKTSKQELEETLSKRRKEEPLIVSDLTTRTEEYFRKKDEITKNQINIVEKSQDLKDKLFQKYPKLQLLLELEKRVKEKTEITAPDAGEREKLLNEKKKQGEEAIGSLNSEIQLLTHKIEEIKRNNPWVTEDIEKKKAEITQNAKKFELDTQETTKKFDEQYALAEHNKLELQEALRESENSLEYFQICKDNSICSKCLDLLQEQQRKEESSAAEQQNPEVQNSAMEIDQPEKQQQQQQQ